MQNNHVTNKPRPAWQLMPLVAAAVAAAFLITAAVRPAESRNKPAELDKGIIERVVKLYQSGKYVDGIALLEKTLTTLRAKTPPAGGAISMALLLRSLMQMELEQLELARDGAIRALEIRRELYGDDHLQTAAAFSVAADAYRLLGNYAQAEKFYLKSLATRERDLPPDDADLAWTLNNYALNLHAQTRFADADGVFKRALNIRETKFGPDAPVVADTLDGIGNNAFEQGRYDAAEAALKRSLLIRRNAFKDNDPRIATSLSNLARLHQAKAEFKEAIRLNQGALEIREKFFGKDSVWAGISRSALAIVHSSLGEYDKAETHYQEALKIYEKRYGADHIVTAVALNNLAELRARQHRFTEAEEYFARALKIREAKLGNKHRDFARTLAGLANVYVHQARFSSAQSHYEQALKILEKVLGPKHAEVARTLSGLARAHHNQSHFRRAERLNKRALRIRENSLGPDHPDVATSLEALALGLHEQGRYDDAEPLLRRALAINEASLAKNHLSVAVNINNLARLLDARGQLDEAATLFERAIAAFVERTGEISGTVAAAVNNLGAIRQRQEKFAQAEELFERAARISTLARGHDHPETVVPINNLASLYTTQEKYAEAEPLLQRTLSVTLAAYGPDHPSTALSYANLATLALFQGDWHDARAYLRQSTRIYIAQTNKALDPVGQSLVGKAMSVVERQSAAFQALIKSSYRLRGPMLPASTTPGNIEFAIASDETFIAAQWATSSQAAQSLAKMSVRTAKGDKTLAALIRERQDKIQKWRQADRALIAMRARPAHSRSNKTILELEARLDEIAKRIGEIDSAIARDFPAYAELANPQPVSIKDTQAALQDDEAMIVILPTGEMGPAPGETFVWVITKTKAHVHRSPLGREDIATKSRILRCGLDTSSWHTKQGLAFCVARLKDTLKFGRLPFNAHAAEVAHDLYNQLIAPAQDLIAGRQLLIVPSGALASLPFHVLIAKKTQSGGRNRIDYAKVHWLVKDHAITVLPSVSSLGALRRQTNIASAKNALLGYGDPALDGGPHCGRIKTPDVCPSDNADNSTNQPREPKSGLGRILAGLPLAPGTRGSTDIDRDKLRSHCPLPDTAFELRCVAESLKPQKSQIVLGKKATETHLKALSESGELARFRVLHFATHGILAGELKSDPKTDAAKQSKTGISQAVHEAGLILTPPQKPSEHDDGLLTTSEISSLKLNAEWVILSACNTAAGDSAHNQAFSGLTRAFFYAGSRALLVSHWYVYSPAAVKLTSQALASLSADPTIGRAEAMRRSMLKLIETGSSFEIHPAYWAPFVIVGEGRS